MTGPKKKMTDVMQSMGQFTPELLRYVRKLGAHRDQAEDFVQETFRRVCQAKAAGALILEPRAYCYRTAQSVMIDDKRNRDTVRNWRRQVDVTALQSQKDPIDELSASEEIASVTGQLEDREVELLKLDRYHEKSCEEIAREFGCSIHKIRRALTAMRAKLIKVRKDP